MVSSTEILNKVRTTDNYAVLQDLTIGETNKTNELLMFVKPEIFLVDDAAKAAKALDMIFAKLDEFNASVSGMAIVSGKALEDHEIMNRHYGYINEISRTASTVVDDADRASIAEKLGVNSLEGYAVLGGHEVLAKHPSLDATALDELWFTKKSIKLRSGFYFESYDIEGEQTVLINGFHPAQLAHYTNSGRRLLLILVHSDTDWKALRGDLIGETFPEKAEATSIRGILHADPAAYGFESVTIANNGVHLSAGPFEAVVEILNFFGQLMNVDAKTQPPLLVKKMQAAGLSYEQAMGILDNPDVQVNGETTDLFGASEDINTADAVELWRNAV